MFNFDLNSVNTKIKMDNMIHILKIKLALCGSPSALAFVEKIRSLEKFTKAQKTIEKMMTIKKERLIFLNILITYLTSKNHIRLDLFRSLSPNKLTPHWILK